MRAARDKTKLEGLLEREGEALLRTAVERGKAGDSAALRMALDRIWPVRERATQLDDMPEVTAIADVPMAVSFIVGAVSRGEITPGEGNALCSLLGALRQTFETAELAERLAEVERRMGASQ
jgi:hypothetical protein